MGYFFNFDKMEYLNSPRDGECIFCSIVSGTNPSVDLSIHRESQFLVSVNLYPYNPGHLMIIPSRHVTDIRQLTEEESIRLISLERQLLHRLDEIYRPSGFNVGYNIGRDAGGSIEHLHLHLIPRYRGEIGITDILAGSRMLVEPPDVTRDRVAESISANPLID